MSLSLRDHLTPSLAKLASRLTDKKPILEAMGTELQKITQGSFNNASWRVSPWAPLKPSTIAAKRAAKTTMSGILRRSGELRNNWHLSYTNSTVTLTSGAGAAAKPPVPYAAYHQFGTCRIPARPMLPFIGGPDSATLAPFAREKIQKIGQAKMDSLLKQAAG